MKRVGIVLFTVFSILFLIAVGVATMLLVGEDKADSTPTLTVTEPPTAAPTAHAHTGSNAGRAAADAHAAPHHDPRADRCLADR